MLRPGHTFKMQDLQQDGRKIVETAADGPVGLTRNGELVAGIVSVEDLSLLARTKELLERAMWLFAAERGFGELANGQMRDWRDFRAEVRARRGA